jgi:pimeloyl-ACP methyl ester carboxylesterase
MTARAIAGPVVRGGLVTAAWVFFAAGNATSQRPSPAPSPIEIVEQGSFMVGGTVVTNPGTFDPRDPNPTPTGQTVHGDHAYVRYQIPVNRRRLPVVMWHGGAQFSKSWETTPDGREGFQTIFLRRGFATYIIDQPRSAGASRTPELAARQPPQGRFGEQAIFTGFRLGVWPDFFPGVQFSRDPAALEQFWRQQVPNTAELNEKVFVDATVALFEKIGPAVLVTHSASGIMGWRTALRTDHVKGIVAYEPVGFLFPESEIPAPVPSSSGDAVGIPVPLLEFQKLTRIPIQLVYGDNIPSTPSPNVALDAWRSRLEMARRFVAALTAHGGDAELLHLPSIGVRGNTHFPFSDLNNVRVADLLSDYLKKKHLDTRPSRPE